MVVHGSYRAHSVISSECKKGEEQMWVVLSPGTQEPVKVFDIKAKEWSIQLWVNIAFITC